MRVWIARAPQAFGNKEGPPGKREAPAWYGWAGGSDICAVLVADDEDQARRLLDGVPEKLRCMAFDESYAEWSFEAVGTSDASEPAILLYAYGSY